MHTLPKPIIPYARQDIDESDLSAVSDVLQSDWLTQGPTVERFEQAVAAYCGARFGVSVNSGTSALHVSFLALGLGPGDELWTSPNTFVATANAALLCGASVDFVDIDPHTYNLSPTLLRQKLVRARTNGRLPKIVVPVHFAGLPCDLSAIAELAAEFGFRVVEDAAHALGATAYGSRIGAGRHSDITVLSFHPVKMITTAEGGMAVTNDAVLAGRMQRLRSHGVSRDPAIVGPDPDGPWYYTQSELGLNYRLTDLQAALGLSQLARLNDFLARRRGIAKRYRAAFDRLDMKLPAEPRDMESAWHLYVVQVPESEAGAGRRRIFDRLRASGINVNVHFIPVHTQPYYQRRGFQRGDFPNAEKYYWRAISLPMFPGLDEYQQDYVIEQLRSALGG
jgi:UDP-4-amino-4,6-dideoxy-N-acetyl-beta-L-altrosamine transaminase